MRLINFFLILSLLFILNGCKTDKPDAYRCILVLVDDIGNKAPIDQWYWYCKNMSTSHVIRKSIIDSDKCIRQEQNDCKWTGTDVQEYDKAKKFYEGK